MNSQSISDYALIGNTRGAALVGKNGSIDWCCLPEFDSPAVFSLLLGRNGGFFAISPQGDFRSSQAYMRYTNVVVTTFETKEGVVRLSDAFCVMEEDEKKSILFPDHEILRIVEGVTGSIRFKLEFVPRLFYGKLIPKIIYRGKLGVHFGWNEHICILNSTLEPDCIEILQKDGRVSAIFDVAAGKRLIFSLAYSSQSPAIIPELKLTGVERMNRTIAFWKTWIGRCTYGGRYLDSVQRSALTLKLLSHAPSGAIIAAPTTSLPEDPGGERNWDYRYCWLRDASFTARALIKLGYYQEMNAYLNWILHATQLTRPKLQVVYSVYGHAKLKEIPAAWLSGYMNSKPVRIGNDAHKQFQLDVYGEVLDAIYAYATVVKSLDNSMRKFALGLGRVICDKWDKPDNGIWEIRSEKQHTHSKVMAWAGLNRLVQLAEYFSWKKTPIMQFKRVQAQIQNKIETSGYNENLGSYTQELNGSNLDSSLLVLPLVGYCDAKSPRMIKTTDLIYSKLSRNNLIYRYKNIDDGIKGSEGAFAICNFWLSENFVQRGDLERGIKLVDAVLNHAPATGLLAEEIDPQSGEMIGNYPQGFTHIGLINAAVTIDEVEKQRGQ